MNDSFTIEEELIASLPDADRQKARNICGAMMFEKDAALKKISVLSGGEKSRVMLGKLLMTPLNLLLLDEPSNHLDMESCDAFIEALDDFDGAALLVTHNEMFLHALANRLVIFKNDQVELFEGTYQEFLDKKGWDDEIQPKEKKKKIAMLTKKQLRQKKSEIITEKSKKTQPFKKKIVSLENDIEKNDTKIADTNAQLLDASMNQLGPQIQELSKQLSQLEKLNEQLFDQLEKQTDQFENLEKKYNNLLEECERDD